VSVARCDDIRLDLDPLAARTLGYVLRSRSRASAATFGANGINALIIGIQAIILVPLYLHAIGPRLYGAWLASAEVLVWMQATDLGIPNLMIQRIASAYARNDRRLAAEWFVAGMLVLTLISVLIAAAGIAIALVLPGWVGAPADQSAVLSKAFFVGLIATCVTLIANGFVGLARAIQDTYFLSASLVISALAGLVTSLALVLNGWGLWAIPLGLVARAAVGFAAALFFGVHAWRADFGLPFRIRRRIVNELLKTSPMTAIGGISYSLMSQCEIVLVAVFIGPEIAVVYALTRRAADFGRSIVDMIGFASYGGVAHLSSSVDQATVRTTYGRLLALHLAFALAIGAAYLAVNRSLVSVWVGPSTAAGIGLIFVMSIQSVVLGHSYLINLLYRATGKVVEGSTYLVMEALVRVPLLAIMLLLIGLPGLPIAAIATALASAILVRRQTFRELGGERSQGDAVAIWTVRALVVGFAAALSLAVFVPRWPYVLITGILILVIGGLALVSVDSRIRPLIGSAARQLLPAVVSSRL
jgi:O-antigen/teichoic acid export membrane protein